MVTHRLVLPEDLNHLGFLFGGRLLAWVDEACWIAASLDFPHCQFVTVGMDKVEFCQRVNEGAILAIASDHESTGFSSVTYRVKVEDQRNRGMPIFATQITYVSVDDQGAKRSI